MAVDWQALERIGGVATAIALVVAIGFGIAHVRQAERQRRLTASAELIGSLLAPHVIAAHGRLLVLRDDTPPETFESDAALRDAFYALGFAMKGIGLLVFERGLDLHAVDRPIGGAARATWRKVRGYTERERARTNPSMGEWWQWLVERMDEDPAPGKREGAHVAFREWRA